MGLRGAALDEFVDEVAEKYGLSEKTVRRLLDPKRELSITLTGSDVLLTYMHQQAISKIKPPN